MNAMGPGQCNSLNVADTIMVNTGNVSINITTSNANKVYTNCSLEITDHGNNSVVIPLDTFVIGTTLDDFCLHPDLTIPQSECEALYALYTNTDGAHWTNATNWFAMLDVDTWYGIITTGTTNQHIISINLALNNLAGTLADGFASQGGGAALPFLKDLLLENNAITDITTQIGLLNTLETLYLNDNLMTNVPDEIGDLTALLDLDLSNLHKNSTGSLALSDIFAHLT